MAKSFHGGNDKFEHRRKAAVKRARKTDAEKRADRRARHWRNTGVSESTIGWMRDGGWL